MSYPQETKLKIYHYMAYNGKCMFQCDQCKYLNTEDHLVRPGDYMPRHPSEHECSITGLIIDDFDHRPERVKKVAKELIKRKYL